MNSRGSELLRFRSEKMARRTAAFDPSVWGDYFITNPSLHSSCKESEAWMKQRVGVLILEVREMLSSNEGSLLDMHLIDSLQRLGVDYHFEKEIGQALQRIHDVPSDQSDFNLDRVALRFRLLRQHRYDVSSDVFEIFRDGQGNFNSSIVGDVKGLLSLYEAAYLGKHGEDILDEAINFARRHLQSMLTNMDPESALAKQVFLALKTPLRRKMQRLEARHYISIYENDHELPNGTVLELAKLDFHLLQLLYREEVKTICTWWKNFNAPAKFTFARDRIVECYFWVLGVYFEPHYTRARMTMTKLISLFSLMDDLYDNYGTIDELQQYTDMLQRWSTKDIKQLEECYELHFLTLTSTVKEFEDELAKEGFSNRIHYLKEAIGEVNRAFLVEAKWREKGHIPSFEDHLKVSLVTTCYSALACASFIGMGDVVTKEVLDWVICFPKVIKSITIICRLMDDVVGYKFETKRDHVASTIHCYMNDYGTTFDETCDKLLVMVEDAWREINEEFLNIKDVETHLLMRILNLARMIETIYRNEDGYTHSRLLKEYINLLLVKPIDFY